jgi:hypothetical protein
MTKIHRINYQDLFALRQRLEKHWYDYRGQLDFPSKQHDEDLVLLNSLMDAAIYRDTLEIYNRPQNS